MHTSRYAQRLRSPLTKQEKKFVDILKRLGTITTLEMASHLFNTHVQSLSKEEQDILLQRVRAVATMVRHKTDGLRSRKSTTLYWWED